MQKYNFNYQQSEFDDFEEDNDIEDEEFAV